MNILKINNDYSALLTEHEKLKKVLWELLRWRAKDYFHNRRYQQKKWDGYIDFFDRDTGRFLTGLLPEVRLALKRLKVEYHTLDERDQTNFKYSEIDKYFLNQNKPPTKKDIELYDYQVDFINQILYRKRGTVLSPTGSGKTNILIGALKSLPPNTPTLVLVNKQSLVVQNYEAIRDWGIEDVGMYYAKKKDVKNITVVCVNSIKNIKHVPKVKAVFVDEIHEMMGKMAKSAYRRFKQADIRVALSATPFKWGGTDRVQKYYVKGYFGPVLKTAATESGILTTKELQERGILSVSDATFYPIDQPEIPFEVYQDAVTKGLAENYYFHDVVKRLATNQTGRTLILVERIDHGDTLNRMIPGSLWVRGKDDIDTRKQVIEQLKYAKGNVVAIATQGIFNTGIDVFVHNLINAAGGKAEHVILQRMGRGLRTADDKELLKYYDFIFRINDYLYEHSGHRVRILKKHGHKVTVKDEIDF